MAKLKVRARAVDMLGRQQIAGIPTALHELLKNAHDAYAERAEIDFIRKTNTLVLRDDGYGMTLEDVENRWLTVGTDSRVVKNDKLDGWTGPKGLPNRTVMGEKGIGRLAIAIIAPITLLMTRAVRPETGLHNLVIALVHWGLFEQPGLDISQIDVPIEEFSSEELPGAKDIERLAAHVRKNIDGLKSEISENAYQTLMDQLNGVKISPDRMDMFLNNEIDSNLSLSRGGYGTHFVMLPTTPELVDDIENHSDGSGTPLETTLLGFSNTMDGTHPVLTIFFRDHTLNGEITERVSDKLFINTKDLHKFDHWIDGIVNDNGQFIGKISIYQQKPIEFICNWKDGRGRRSKCGPFTIKFGYLQGSLRDSLISPEKHSELIKKLDRIGGLYIYKDGIRVLPYGNSDYDFLEIEKRRTKSAQDWFFSHRRIAGYIAINQQDNLNLNEKAGREGFRHNQAYRDFRQILMNLFQNLALEFFRTTAYQAEIFWEKRKQLNEEHKALERQRKKADERRKVFRNLLTDFFEKLENNKFHETSSEIVNRTIAQLDKLMDLDNASEGVIEIDKIDLAFSLQIRDLNNELTIQKPRGLAIREPVEKDWNAYTRVAAKLKSELIDDARVAVGKKFQSIREKRVDPQHIRENSIMALSAQSDVIVKDLTALRRQSYNATEEMRRTLREIIKNEFAEFRVSIEGLISKFTEESAENPEKINQLRGEIENQFVEIQKRDSEFFNSIRRNMEDLAEDLREGQTTDDRIGAIEQTNIRLQEQLDFLIDFAQIGMSVGILQHEFEQTAHDFRVSMRNLKPWADGTPRMNVVYQKLRQSFDHLDSYLGMLDPIGRRGNRRKIDINGEQINIYLDRIFGRKYEEEKIIVEATSEFNSRSVKCYSSSLLGAFSNVIDNAIYWLSNGAKNNKKIIFSVDKFGFLISNSGPGIEVRHKDSIFEFGESTKPNGRGMGLAISREALKRDGFELELIQWGRNKAPVFRIRAETPEEDEQDASSTDGN